MMHCHGMDLKTQLHGINFPVQKKQKYFKQFKQFTKMVRTVISLYLLCFCSMVFAQKIEQKTIYIQFKLDKKCPQEQKFFYEKEKGTVFNLFCDKGGSFLWSSRSDTLHISKLKNYKFSTLEEIEVFEKKWRIKNRKAMIKKFGMIYPSYDKNGIFKTHLIEIINDKQFVIYPVEWRGEDVACGLDEVPPPPRNNR